MKVLLRAVFLIATLTATSTASASIISYTLGADYSGTVASEDGWLMGDTTAIDFFTFSVAQDTTLSFEITADTSFGMSLYSGMLENDPGFLFSNNSDFSDFLANSFTYLAGTDGFVPGAGNNILVDVMLAAGEYTLALGGNEGFSLGEAGYSMTSSFTSADVSEPSTLAALMMGLVLLSAVRKQQK